MEYPPLSCSLTDDVSICYPNYHLRNVHVWSPFGFESEPAKIGRIALLGGCYTDPQGKDTWCMTNCDLYGLMERVVYPPKNTPSSFYLKKFSFDPTTMRATEFFNQAIQCLLRVTDPFILPDNSPAEEGHYLLLQWYESDQRPVTRAPVLATSKIRSRKPIKDSETATLLKPRSDKTRELTRARDNRCRISGIKPAYFGGSRQWNHAGFQCCHIVPLAHLRYVKAWPGFVRPELQQYVTTREDADMPYNCLLLRSDIHDQMDDYQFSFRPPGAGERERRIVKFEKGGAQSLPTDGSYSFLRSSSPLDEADIWRRTNGRPGSALYATSVELKEALLDSHWFISVLLNVSGYGRE